MANISVAGDTSTHGGAPFNQGLSTTVFAGNKAVAVKDQTTSSSPDSQYDGNLRPQHSAANQKANAGSTKVFANNKPIHRVGDARIDGATSGPGIASVQID
ncbi:PAAR motif [uncultured Caudovirales phage]|uniref:PAAR motif n=1 Tax=uncultured Caudovirales phage TaxID=2100421 RepID=A0A6J5KRP9_9CAUD|nr:PAAR motif [uncultured Caudovirales phage]CAB5208655.1 PAAR motif [uncultured Caudovirales phage]